MTGIYVARDGSIRTAEITEFSNEGFDRDRYDTETLRSYVTGWVDSYNSAKGKASVRIETIDVTDGVATLILYYDSLNAFIDFQGEDFGITSLRVGTAEFAARNFALSGLKDTEGNTVTPIDALQDEDVTVVDEQKTEVPYKITVTGDGIAVRPAFGNVTTASFTSGAALEPASEPTQGTPENGASHALPTISDNEVKDAEGAILLGNRVYRKEI